jgi:hypothetical protein
MMFRKRLAFLSALYLASVASSFAADMPLSSPAPVACPPPHSVRHVVRRHIVRHVIVRREGYGVEGAVIGVNSGAGLAWGLTEGVGQLGAAGLGYYGVNGCWVYRPAFDRFGNYFGRRLVNMCL